MDGDLLHGYMVHADNDRVLLTKQDGDLPAAEFDSLEEAAARILTAELGIEVDGDTVVAFTKDVLAPRMPSARIDADQLWRWIDR